MVNSLTLDKTSKSVTHGSSAMRQDVREEDLEELRQQLRLYGGFVLGTDVGRIVVTDVKHLIRSPAILVVYEGGGAMIFEFDRPLNPFRLMSKGFPSSVAAKVSDLINGLFYRAEQITVVDQGH